MPSINNNTNTYPLPNGSDFLFQNNGIDSSGNIIKCDRGIAMSDDGHWLACAYSTERTIGTRSLLGEIVCEGFTSVLEGACCLGNFQCGIYSEYLCVVEYGGVYMGDRTDCDSCEHGACCLGGTSCQDGTAADCSAAGGTYIDGSSCSDAPCACICQIGNSCEQKVTGGNVCDWFGCYFGNSVSISGDGTTAIVGAYRADTNGPDSGSAYIYELVSGVWVEKTELLASEGGQYDQFGYSVSISGDGTTAIVGAPLYYDNGIPTGSAYIYRFGGSDWDAGTKLTASDGASGDRFGTSVSISSNGTTAIVGAPGDDDNGSAYVFHLDGDDWDDGTKLTAFDGEEGGWFGSSVSISGDGTTAIVGAYREGNDDLSGAVYIYELVKGVWGEPTKIKADDWADYNYFGWSVAISGDTMVVGAFGASDNGNVNAGSAYIYRRDGGVWGFETKLSCGGDFCGFGRGVSIDGDVVVIGAWSENASGQNSAFVYLFDGSEWVEQIRLLASDGYYQDGFGHRVSIARTIDGYRVLVGWSGWTIDGPDDVVYFYKCDIVGSPPPPKNAPAGRNYLGETACPCSSNLDTCETKLTASDGEWSDYFGNSVSISSDGTTAIVGAYGDDNDNGTNSGSAYIYTQQMDDTWQQTAKLTASDGASGDRFGHSVSITSDGTTAIVGTVDDDGNAVNTGSAYVFRRVGDDWSVGTKLTADDGSDHDFFGCSVAISDDGNTVIVGAYGDDNDNGTNSGSAYIYQFDGDDWDDGTKLLASDGEEGDYFGYSVSITSDGTTALVGAIWDDNDNGTNSGSAYIYTQQMDDTWQQTAKLTAEDGASSDYFGYSVSITSDGTTALVGAYRNGSLSGSAYIYTQQMDDTWQQTAKLTASDGASFDHFGNSVAISGDTVVVGALYDDDNGDSSGSAYVFRSSGSEWTQVAKLLASDGVSNDRFGDSVAVSRNGSDYTVLVGAQYNDGNSVNSGSAYVYQCSIEDDGGCGDPDGACCIGTSCTYVTESECDASGGEYHGASSTCADANDCQPTAGACCYGNANCNEVTKIECISGCGKWKGWGSECGDQACTVYQPLVGSCCYPNGTCDDGISCPDCQGRGGTFNGEGTLCSSDPCSAQPFSEIVGACCIDNQCFQLTEDECNRSNGNYLGDNETCNASSCQSFNYSRTYTEEISVYKRSTNGNGSSFDLVANLPYPYNASVDRIQGTSYGNFLNAINGNCFDLEEYDIALNENGTLLSMSGYTLLDSGVRYPHILTWYRDDYSGYSWTLVQDTRFINWGETEFNNGSAFKGLIINRGRVFALAYQIDRSSTKILKVEGFNREDPGDISVSVVLDSLNPQSSINMDSIYSFDVTTGYMSIVSGSFDGISIIKEVVDLDNADLHWDYDILGENHTELSTLKLLSNASYDFYNRNSVNNIALANSTHVKMKNFEDSGICLVTHGRDKNMSINTYIMRSRDGKYGINQTPIDWVISENSLPQNPSRVYQSGLDRNNMIRGLYCKHISESSGLCLLSDPRFGSESYERGRVYPYLYLGEDGDDNGYNFIFCHTQNLSPIVNGSYSSGIEYGGTQSSSLFGFSCFAYEDLSGLYISSLSCDPSSGGIMSFYKFNSVIARNRSSNSGYSVFSDLGSDIISSYALDVSYDRWDKRFKSAYVGFDSSEVRDISSVSLLGGELNISNGKVIFEDEEVVLMSSGGPVGDEDGSNGEDSSSVSVEIIDDKSQSIYSQFGILFHDDGFGGSHGDSSSIKLEDAKISAVADSVTGIFELNDTLTKYDNIKVDIKGAGFKNRGSAPHVVLEDTFEGINSGLPSFLGQVQQLNILRSGLSLKRRNPYDFDSTFIPFQSNYSLSCDSNWYDKFNSTVDFTLQKDNSPLDISLSFPSTIFEKEEDDVIWVGGPEGVIEIDGRDYSVSVPDILLEYDIKNVIKIRGVGSEILVLSLDYLLIIDEYNNIELDPMYGVNGRPNDINRMMNGVYIICTDDGIYSRMSGDSSYVKDYGQDLYSTGTFDKFFMLEYVAGFMFSISENTISITSNGKIWGSYEAPLPNSESNKLFKFRNGQLLLTNFGVFYDNGTLLEESYNLQLLSVLGVDSTGSDNSAVRANDAGSVVEIAEDGTVLQSELFIAISDGSYSLSTSSLDDFTNYTNSGFSSIHKVMRFQERWLVFSFDNFKFIDDTNTYRLSTGLRI